MKRINSLVKSSRPTVAALCLLALLPGPLAAQPSGLSAELELGASWQHKNTIQIPNDANGTRFSAKDLAGDGPWTHVRFNGLYHFNDTHALRVVLAPFSYSETAVSGIPINFDNQGFLAGEPLKVGYTFNSWRIGYQYHFYQRENMDMWVGVTGKIRDAEISLEQGSTQSVDDNIGFVPLLYFATQYRFNDKWSVFADIDGLAGGPGRAFDLSVKINYTLNNDWKVGLGYRTLEGGVDNDVYNFAWFNTVLLSVGRNF